MVTIRHLPRENEKIVLKDQAITEMMQAALNTSIMAVVAVVALALALGF